MGLSRLLDLEHPHARVAAVAVLGAMLVGGCALTNQSDLTSTAANAAAQAADTQRTARVRDAVHCDLGAPSTRVQQVAVDRPATTARAAVTNAGLPGLTYADHQVDATTHLFTATHDGKVRVAVGVIQQPAGWIWDTVAWCDQAELPAASDKAAHVTVWTDKDGRRVATRFVHTQRLDRAEQECLGERVSILIVDGRRYVDDPLHAYSGRTHGQYRDGASLPAGAVDTGFRSDGAALWRDIDQNYVYLVDGKNTRRLPLEKTPPTGVC